MENVVLVIHLFLALAIIGLVLLQRSEGGGLGIGGGGGGGLGGFASGKAAANALTKATTYCAAAFFGTSLLLGILAGQNISARQGILEAAEDSKTQLEQETEEEKLPEAPLEPVETPPEAPIE